MIDFKYVVLYLIAINVIGFIAMGVDKRKAKRMEWRIPEKTLFLITLFGGGVGTIAGMYTFRHKTKKLKFTVGMPVIILSEIFIIAYFAFQFIFKK
jgi:uncharacterized membrane protein YsdA (DUF1294 family)